MKNEVRNPGTVKWEHVGPVYTIGSTVLSNFRRKANRGLASLSRDEINAYGEAVEKAVLSAQRSSLSRVTFIGSPNCASGTWYSDGNDIDRAIKQQHRAALFASVDSERRNRTPRQWQEMYEKAMLEKQQASKPQRTKPTPRKPKKYKVLASTRKTERVTQMMTNVTTIRPGFLVSLKTSLRGNVQYQSEVIESEHYASDGAKKATWQTQRIIRDPMEHENATKLRSQIRNMITGQCVKSAFGLLCTDSNGDKLEEVIRQATELANRFNRSAMLSRVNVNVLVGRIAADDANAIRALNSEIRDLMDGMAQGLLTADAKVIRENANKARGIAQMLSPSARAEVDAAIADVRKVARKLVKAGDAAAIEVDQVTLAKVRSARASFLDYDTDESTTQPEAPSSTLAPRLGDVVSEDVREFILEATGKDVRKPTSLSTEPKDDFVIPRARGRRIDYAIEE